MLNRKDRMKPARGRRAFSLVEVLITMAILAILAAIVLPRFSNASVAASGVAIKQNLVHLRQQIKLYTVHHEGVAPGYPGGTTGLAPTETAFVDQMTKGTDRKGNVGLSSSPLFPMGPYIMEIPTNPINGSNATLMLGDGVPFPGLPVGDTGFGWIYQPETQQICAYVPGVDERGVPYFDY